MQKVTSNKLDALTFGIDYKISDNLVIHQPTIREIREYGYEKYISTILRITGRPYDNMVALYDLGIDFRKLDEYVYFLTLIAPMIDEDNLSLVFKDFSFNDYVAISDIDGKSYLYNGQNMDTFDKETYEKMVDFLRSAHFFPKETEYNVGNSIMYEWLIKRERRKLKKLNEKPRTEITMLSDMVSYLIWCSNGSYNFDTIQDITLYQLYEGVKRSQADKRFAYISNGIYAGNVDSSKLNFDDIDPLRHFNNDERKIVND